jgi:hypothetical protein
MEDNNNGSSLICSTWHHVRDWEMPGGRRLLPFMGKLVTVVPHRHAIQHPPEVRTICYYSPCLPESRSICMSPSGRVEIMHGKAYRGGLPCVTNKCVYYFVSFCCAFSGSLMLVVSFSICQSILAVCGYLVARLVNLVFL